METGQILSGTVPTDKKFTGQRLDATGLYFYNARYYDAIIGRFISADTIIQSSINPQMLNRYSYTLNNPLKGIDPTGHRVVIDGVDMGCFYDYLSSNDYMGLLSCSEHFPTLFSDPLFEAYDTLRTVAPGLANELESGTRTQTMILMDLGDPTVSGGITAYSHYTDTIITVLNSNLCDMHPGALVGTMGHEGFHAAEYMAGVFTETVAGEAFAFSCGHWIGAKVGYDMSELHPASAACSILHPAFAEGLSNYEGSIRYALSTNGYPKLATADLFPRDDPSFDFNPYERFMDVATRVWPVSFSAW